MGKSEKLFPCSTFVLFITAVDKKTSESKNEENNETYTVLGKMDQIMACLLYTSDAADE